MQLTKHFIEIITKMLKATVKSSSLQIFRNFLWLAKCTVLLSSTIAARYLASTWAGKSRWGAAPWEGGARNFFFDDFGQFLVFHDRILCKRNLQITNNKTLRVTSRDKDWFVEVHSSYHGAQFWRKRWITRLPGRDRALGQIYYNPS